MSIDQVIELMKQLHAHQTDASLQLLIGDFVQQLQNWKKNRSDVHLTFNPRMTWDIMQRYAKKDETN